MPFLKLLSFLIFWSCFMMPMSAQERTVGVINEISSNSYEGYNLIYPHFQPNVYLLDQCGRVLHQWDDTASTPGNIAYIGPNGNLFKAKKPNTLPNPTFGAGGAGGVVEVRDWDNNLLWTRTWMDSVFRQHHDLELMPNGNLLVIVWERFKGQDVIDQGAAIPDRWGSEEIWSDAIFEIDYVNDTIVWEWHAWDHTIQDEDNTKANFGVVADHPEKIDINYAANTVGRPDWLHINSIDYNSDLDQILLSVPHLDEVWIIDHSTTSAEAATNNGGNSGKGGGIIYRWGNPESHARGTDDDRQLFFEHDANWIDEVSSDHPFQNKISIFNNRVEDSLSVAIIIDPTYDDVNNLYPQNNNFQFAPATPEFSIVHPDSVSMFSSGLSSFQVLDNNNFLITSGRNGYAFEIDQDQNIFWEFRTPLLRGDPVDQFTNLAINDNITFKLRRYPLDYTGFAQLTIPEDAMSIETNNPAGFCGFLTPTFETFKSQDIALYPNPSNSAVYIDVPEGMVVDVVIYNSIGQSSIYLPKISGLQSFSVSELPEGFYYVHIPELRITEKLIVTH